MYLTPPRCVRGSGELGELLYRAARAQIALGDQEQHLLNIREGVPEHQPLHLRIRRAAPMAPDEEGVSDREPFARCVLGVPRPADEPRGIDRDQTAF